MVVHAAPEYVHAALTDYPHVYRFTPTIVESEVLPSPDKEAVRVRTRIEDCMACFCVDLVSVADIWERPSGDLRVVVVPELSTFRSGSAEWRIRPHPGGSHVVYEARMEPDIFVPPVVGPYFVKKTLLRETLTAFARLERMAMVRARQAAPDAGGMRTSAIGMAPPAMAEDGRGGGGQ